MLIYSISNMLAYIGPGLGAGVVATILGLLAALFLFLFAIIWYPVKRLIKSMKASREGRLAKRTKSRKTN